MRNYSTPVKNRKGMWLVEVTENGKWVQQVSRTTKKDISKWVKGDKKNGQMFIM